MTGVPDDNLHYPELITLDNGSTGSGFFLNKGEHILLCTAKHVLWNQTAGALASDGCTLTGYSYPDDDLYELKVDTKKLHDDGDLLLHNNADVAVGKLFSVSAEGRATFPAAVRMITKPSGGRIIGVNVDNIHELADVGVSNSVYVFGYPNSIGLQGNPSHDHTRPLIRGGLVAGKHNEKIILDCSVYQGNSGGLVIEAREALRADGFGREFRAIGVVSEFIPFVELTKSLHFSVINQNVENSGYSVAEPMDRVLELVDRLSP